MSSSSLFFGFSGFSFPSEFNIASYNQYNIIELVDSI